MENENIYLETQPLGKLMKKYAVPCVISLLVGALYNIDCRPDLHRKCT